jgi:hypothetical protein
MVSVGHCTRIRENFQHTRGNAAPNCSSHKTTDRQVYLEDRDGGVRRIDGNAEEKRRARQHETADRAREERHATDDVTQYDGR